MIQNIIHKSTSPDHLSGLHSYASGDPGSHSDLGVWSGCGGDRTESSRLL